LLVSHFQIIITLTVGAEMVQTKIKYRLKTK